MLITPAAGSKKHNTNTFNHPWSIKKDYRISFTPLGRLNVGLCFVYRMFVATLTNTKKPRGTKKPSMLDPATCWPKPKPAPAHLLHWPNHQTLSYQKSTKYKTTGIHLSQEYMSWSYCTIYCSDWTYVQCTLSNLPAKIVPKLYKRTKPALKRKFR